MYGDLLLARKRHPSCAITKDFEIKGHLIPSPSLPLQPDARAATISEGLSQEDYPLKG